MLTIYVMCNACTCTQTQIQSIEWKNLVKYCTLQNTHTHTHTQRKDQNRSGLSSVAVIITSGRSDNVVLKSQIDFSTIYESEGVTSM